MRMNPWDRTGDPDEGTKELNRQHGVLPIAEYSAWVKNRIQHHGNGQLVIALLGLGGEVGELFEHYKKNRDRGRLIDKAAIRLELGDILFYLTAIAEHEGITLQEVARANIDKLIARDGVNNERYKERQ